MDEKSTPEPLAVEADPRFPSGPWTGFFLQNVLPGRNWMELRLTFRDGVIDGEGRDRVGLFRINGHYDLVTGRCHWIKGYLKQHRISYQGYNESKGIWGVWEYHPTWKGGFHIWPEGMADPTQQRLAESIDEPALPVEVWADQPEDPSEVAQPVGPASGEALVED